MSQGEGGSRIAALCVGKLGPWRSRCGYRARRGAGPQSISEPGEELLTSSPVRWASVPSQRQLPNLFAMVGALASITTAVMSEVVGARDNIGAATVIAVAISDFG